MVDLPHDRKAIASKWVFRLKRDHNGKIVKHKARLVAKGFSQIPGIDFVETFAPVMRLETFRLLMALATKLGLIIHVVLESPVRSGFSAQNGFNHNRNRLN